MIANKTEENIPNPEFLIKSIAEQGYSFETALADLIDNSISAGARRIEILIDTQKQPFTLFLADDGNGMDEDSLKNNLKFPSNSIEEKRGEKDLGRFGLGLKTASFSQTRCFTTISRKKGDKKFKGRTWDVNKLKDKWKIIVNNADEVDALVRSYEQLSSDYLNSADNFQPNTIVVWQGLFKFENYLDEIHRVEALQKEINEVTKEYLALVFHRFLESPSVPIQIRINNFLVEPFNPFPVGIRAIEYQQRNFKSDIVKIEGFVLPSRSIDEVKKGASTWTMRNKSLMDMEGIYIYRADRLIRYGGWNDIIKKGPRLQLARLRVSVGNTVDHLLHLNVAKSQIVIPHDLKRSFLRYISNLKEEAEKEFYNRVTDKIPVTPDPKKALLFNKVATNKGSALELNENFPLIRDLLDPAKKHKDSMLRTLFRMVNVTINKIKRVHDDKSYIAIEDARMSEADLTLMIATLREAEVSNEQIKELITVNLGFDFEILPQSIKKLLK